MVRNFKLSGEALLGHLVHMPVRKSHPYAKGCDEPAEVTEAREDAMIFDGLGWAEHNTLQTYFLYLIAKALNAFEP